MGETRAEQRFLHWQVDFETDLMRRETFIVQKIVSHTTFVRVLGGKLQLQVVAKRDLVAGLRVGDVDDIRAVVFDGAN